MRMAISSSVLAAALLASPLIAGQDEQDTKGNQLTLHAAETRQGPDSFGLALGRAVARVSESDAGVLLGRASVSRGYRLPGYGILFVLTPRALPGRDAVYVLHEHTGDGPDEPTAHRKVELFATGEGDELRALERQVLVLQRAAEARRRAAEADHARIVRRIRVHLAADGPDESSEAPAETVPQATEPAPPPPWRFWFEADRAQEGRSADRVVADVREAVIGVLESQGASVGGLKGDEFVTVAVDFVPGDFFVSRPRPERTLIVRARQGDLTARARGAMAPEELRARVEVIEY